jgi:hypothetical protein
MEGIVERRELRRQSKKSVVATPVAVQDSAKPSLSEAPKPGCRPRAIIRTLSGNHLDLTRLFVTAIFAAT